MAFTLYCSSVVFKGRWAIPVFYSREMESAQRNPSHKNHRKIIWTALETGSLFIIGDFPMVTWEAWYITREHPLVPHLIIYFWTCWRRVLPMVPLFETNMDMICICFFSSHVWRDCWNVCVRMRFLQKTSKYW